MQPQYQRNFYWNKYDSISDGSGDITYYCYKKVSVKEMSERLYTWINEHGTFQGFITLKVTNIAGGLIIHLLQSEFLKQIIFREINGEG